MTSYTAPGKLNLFFQVGPLRQNGYHDVASVYQAVNLLDMVNVVESNTWEVNTTGSLSSEQLSEIPSDERNLVVKTAIALAQLAGISNPRSMRFDIRKRIPVAGGMAGGSADAAASLLAVNDAWCLGLEKEKLFEVAANLGADVPFSLLGGTAIGIGTGTELTPVESVELNWVIAISNGTLSTPAVFRKLDSMRKELGQDPSQVAEPKVSEELIAALKLGAPEVAKYLHNDLEAPAIALNPELTKTIDLGLRLGALRAIVSGSGPTIAMLCSEQEAAVKLASDLRQRGINAIACHGPVAGATALEN